MIHSYNFEEKNDVQINVWNKPDNTSHVFFLKKKMGRPYFHPHYYRDGEKEIIGVSFYMFSDEKR